MSPDRVRWSDLPAGPIVQPSVYAADLMRLGEQVDELLDAGARAFHVDVGDGRFVPPIILGEVVIEAIARRVHPRGGLVDCHMMVAEPERHVESVAAAGGDSFTFHLEATDDADRTMAAIRAAGLDVGVAVNPGTAVADVVGPAASADVALCMGVHPGRSGQSFIPATTGRVADLRREVPPTVRIQVDGGVDADVAPALAAAGASLFVAGSAIFWRGEPAAGYRQLRSCL